MNTRKVFSRCFYKKTGFTLIEMLVVIAIISLISAGLYTNHLASVRRGRDVRRKKDLTNIQNALEQYFVDNTSSYPSGGCAAAIAGYFSGGVAPTDPRTGAAYSYPVCGVVGYEVCTSTALEFGNGNSTVNDGAGVHCSGDSCAHFCVSNLQ